VTSPHTHAQWLEILDDLIRAQRRWRHNPSTCKSRAAWSTGAIRVSGATVAPGVFAMASPLPVRTDELRANGISAITLEKFPLGAADIKSTALLANVLMKQRAAVPARRERSSCATATCSRGSSTSIFVVTKGRIADAAEQQSHPAGTTRDVAELADGGMQVTIRRIGIDELRAADEVWISAATRDVIPVTRIDDRPVGTGKPGPLWKRMNESFNALRARLAGTPVL
jgi:D-alanine transaminase